MKLRRVHKAPRSPASAPRTRALAKSVLLGLCMLACTFGIGALSERSVSALSQNEGVDIRRVRVGSSDEDARPGAAQRLAWEIRKRTSIETVLEPSTVRLDDPSLFKSPFLYWSGDRAFPALKQAELTGLRRFVEYGGFLLIDDASPETQGFDDSVRRELERAFPQRRLMRLQRDHTLFRSFYLLDRPVGRVAEPSYVEAIMNAGRAAVVYSRHDLGGAWARDERGQAAYDITPGGPAQREQSIRLGVNLVMYALCLDYKDDQVHAPFILRRRGGRP